MKHNIAKVLVFFCGCWFCVWCTLGLILAAHSPPEDSNFIWWRIVKIVTTISIIITGFRIPKILRESKNYSLNVNTSDGKSVKEVRMKNEVKTRKNLEQNTTVEDILNRPRRSIPESQSFRIIHQDDEGWPCGIVGTVIRRNFKNVRFDMFLDGDAAWQALLEAPPDLLITDLRNDNMPSQK